MTGPLNPRRLALGAARKFIFEGHDPETILERISGIDRHGNILKQYSPTPEDLMYSEAFQRAKESGDQSQMTSLDFAYRREQLYFEILLDVRDAVERR